jgi:hypothetical protein
LWGILNKNFDDHTSEPFNSSIKSEIDRRNDGDVRIAWQISDETRAKISYCRGWPPRFAKISNALFDPEKCSDMLNLLT